VVKAEEIGGKPTNPNTTVETLQKTLHAKAKGSPGFRFYSLYDKVYRGDVLWVAYQRCRINGGAAGVDGQTFQDIAAYGEGRWLDELAEELRKKQYRGSAVRRVWIPKPNGKQRPRGIPRIKDRVAQMAVVLILEPIFEADFQPEQYAYRPERSAHDAIRRVHSLLNTGHTEVIDADLSGYFDNLDHDLVLRAVRFHTDLKWLHLYVERWLKAPVQLADGTLRERTRGTPQGGVISPLLSNLFLHHALDDWLRRHYPGVQFERYVDDAVIQCESEAEAQEVREAVRRRLEECGLELHPEKTRIVYCKDDDRPGDYEHVRFDFLGYTFQPKRAKNRWGKYFVSFLPAMSGKAAKRIRATMRGWKLAATRNNQSLEDLARLIDPSVRGWMNYYGRFYRSKCVGVLRHLNRLLVRWACRKFRRFRRRERAAGYWLGRVARRDPKLLVLWALGVRPAAGAVRAV